MGDGNHSNARTDVSFKAAGGGGNSETTVPKRVDSTPHLVGSHAFGAEGGSGGSYNSAAAAAAAVSVLSSAGGALGGLAERAVDAPVRGLRELNRAVTVGWGEGVEMRIGKCHRRGGGDGVEGGAHG